MLSQTLLAIGAPVTQYTTPAFIAILEGFVERIESGYVPAATNLRMQHFVGPVEILEQARKRIAALHAHFVLVAFSGTWHQPLLDEEQHAMTLARIELQIQVA